MAGQTPVFLVTAYDQTADAQANVCNGSRAPTSNIPTKV